VWLESVNPSLSQNKKICPNTVGFTHIIKMIFHTGANFPIFIFVCTSWMIPESVETNKKQFSKKKKKTKRSLLD